AARTQPRRPTLRERVSGRAEQLETAAVTTALRPSPRGAADARTWAAAQPASARVFESLAPAERVQVPASRHLPAGLLWGAAGSVFVAVCVVIRVLAGGSSDIAPEPALAAPAVAANPADTGFTLVSRPAGAHVFVDGKSTGLITPARVRPLSPGLHAVELKLAGYYDTGLPAVLEPGLTVALGDVELRPLPVQEAAAAELAPRPRMRAASSERRSRPARRSRTASSLSSADLAAVSDARPTESSNAPLAAESGGTGLLQINSRPWARILVDGEFVGNTPQRRLPLSAGTHSVRLVNETLRMSKTFSVVIRAGETVTRVESLIEEPVQSGVVTHGRNVLAKLGR
ncbi:MAG TPA: PEGA domain-containing protein, partial [Polyangiales bacterium]|nr:PEGA domain-containing protein [Polyangiales bacterium]